MRAPIGQKIRNLRKARGFSQSGMARSVGISPSYLNLIEANKRDVGGALLQRIAAQMGIPLDELTGDSEQRMIADLTEAFLDPALGGTGLSESDARDLVAAQPQAAAALHALYRRYLDALASAEVYANRLRADPLLAELLHQMLSHITAVRSSAEILNDEADLSEPERQRFGAAISRESRSLSDVAMTLIRQFDREAVSHRSVTPMREVDDLINDEQNYFPALEDAAGELIRNAAVTGQLDETRLVEHLESRFGVRVLRGTSGGDRPGGAGQVHYDADEKVLWFQANTMASTRQFQLARLYGELAAEGVLSALIDDTRLTTADSRRLAYRALSSYLAGAMLMPYEAMYERAEAARYDVDFLAQSFGTSFEQVAHRIVSLKRHGQAGVPFGFLRADPAGRLTKQFPLPGLLLPNAGHACPLWTIYSAFRSPGAVTRQIARFPDGSRYLFIAKTSARRAATYRDQPFYTAIMLACDALEADRTIYGQGLALGDDDMDTLVGPACRLCTRRDCAYRQEEAMPGLDGHKDVRAPFTRDDFERDAAPNRSSTPAPRADGAELGESVK
ncbi:helix-turn-helix domain-containing protein [Cucumibacter marinus]|uniref:helix-turn-helix domain-containing protein n=1 Tax=Cucumibacter marinus TaxID=1121252 RepID=UPI0004060609|nr:helix-turn-helix transcriptional regulator [Cucumibacter marinus]